MPFGLGQSPFPVPQPVVEALQANAHPKDYLAVAGLWELREAIARYLHRKTQVDGAADDVLVGPGSKGLMFSLQLAYYGDLVIPTPSWVCGVPPHAEHGWLMTPDEFERLCAEDSETPRITLSRPRPQPRVLVGMRALSRPRGASAALLLEPPEPLGLASMAPWQIDTCERISAR